MTRWPADTGGGSCLRTGTRSTSRAESDCGRISCGRSPAFPLHGHLVYAKGDGEAMRHVLRRSGVEICCHALDLAAEPTAVLRQISELADEIAALSPMR